MTISFSKIIIIIIIMFLTVIFIYEPVKILVRNQKLGVELFTILFCYFT